MCTDTMVDVHGHGRNGSIVPHIEPIGCQKRGHVRVGRGVAGWIDPSPRKDAARGGSVPRRGGTGNAAVGRSTTPRRVARERGRRIRQGDVVDALVGLGAAVIGPIHFLVLFLEDLNDEIEQIAQALDGRPGAIDHRVGALDGGIVVIVLFGSRFAGS